MHGFLSCPRGSETFGYPPIRRLELTPTGCRCAVDWKTDKHSIGGGRVKILFHWIKGLAPLALARFTWWRWVVFVSFVNLKNNNGYPPKVQVVLLRSKAVVATADVNRPQCNLTCSCIGWAHVGSIEFHIVTVYEYQQPELRWGYGSIYRCTGSSAKTPRKIYH